MLKPWWLKKLEQLLCVMCQGTLTIPCTDWEKKNLSKYAENISYGTDVKDCTYFLGTQQLHFFCDCSEISRNSKNLMTVLTQYVYRDNGNVFFLIIQIKTYQYRNMSADFSDSRAKPVLNSTCVVTLFYRHPLPCFLWGYTILLRNI